MFTTKPFLAKWDWTSPELPVDSWWFFGIILVLLVVFIWAVARLTTRTTDDIDPAEIDRQMLTAVNELRSQGELTQEEFRSIKSRLVERLSDKPQLPDPEASLEDSSQVSEIEASNTDNEDAGEVDSHPDSVTDSVNDTKKDTNDET